MTVTWLTVTWLTVTWLTVTWLAVTGQWGLLLGDTLRPHQLSARLRAGVDHRVHADRLPTLGACRTGLGRGCGGATRPQGKKEGRGKGKGDGALVTSHENRVEGEVSIS